MVFMGFIFRDAVGFTQILVNFSPVFWKIVLHCNISLKLLWRAECFNLKAIYMGVNERR